MEDLTVGWLDPGINYLDTYKMGLMFAWTNQTKTGLEQAHKWTRCRDIIGTYLHGCIEKKYVEHGGIEWEPGDPEVVIEPPTLLLRLGSADFSTCKLTIEGKLDNLVWKAEQKLGLTKTELLHPNQIEEDKGYSWVINFDPFWLTAPVWLNTYLLLLRASPFADNVGDLKDNLKSLNELDGEILGTAGLPTTHNAAALAISTVLNVLATDPGSWKASRTTYFTNSYYYLRGLNYWFNLSVDEKAQYMEKGSVWY